MYRQGLGDCFLLRFPKPNGEPFFIVIDSGVIKGTPQPSAIMRELAEDIERETGGTIDVLVVTHEHWDHVSGFTEAREVWSRMTIREVWLAWSEDPANDLANKLRTDREDKKAAIVERLRALNIETSFQMDGTRGARIAALLGFLGMDLAATDHAANGTKAALDFISSHAKKRVYHEPAKMFSPKELDGVRVYVLGPPQTEKQIKRSNPSKSATEVYSDRAQAFAFGDPYRSNNDSDGDRPFADDLGAPVSTSKHYDAIFAKAFPSLAKDGPDPHWRRISYEGIEDLERLALALDGDTNNTSLALAFELPDGRVLLFPADAQVGNWLSWQDCSWKIGTQNVTTNDLLARTIFYKVGHHGSHNATLKDLGLEKMESRDLIAFVPVDQAMAKKKRWKMPFGPLHERLIEKTRGRVVLADASASLPNGTELAELTSSERERFGQMVTESPLHIDFTL
jgi:hypothetical protein